uniref:Uncharacterized protein n=1 Tax=Nicotiana tabacum TaxID=4097 RepID=A0A1S3XMW7_TOBAC|nr:PREDICTED: uncharacterized protein LOC107766893 [Nicotiana tabacum]
MSLVYGNDRARGDCAKSLDDIGLNCSSEKANDNDIEGPSKENDVQDVVSETSQAKASRKRSRSSDVQDVVSDISTKLREVAVTIGKIADSRLDVTRLYEEIMATEGYKEKFFFFYEVINFIDGIRKMHNSYKRVTTKRNNVSSNTDVQTNTKELTKFK